MVKAKTARHLVDVAAGSAHTVIPPPPCLIVVSSYGNPKYGSAKIQHKLCHSEEKNN